MTREQAAIRAQIQANKDNQPIFVYTTDGMNYYIIRFLPPRGAYQSYMLFEPMAEMPLHQTIMKSPNSWKGPKR